MVEKAGQSFESALDKLKAAASAIISKLRDLSEAPDEVGVEFGFKMSADLGVVLASAGAEAHYRVKLTWKRKT